MEAVASALPSLKIVGLSIPSPSRDIQVECFVASISYLKGELSKSPSMEEYTELLAQAREFMIIKSIKQIMMWDYETHMPPRGVEQRGQQLALLSQLSHRIKSNPRIGELLKRVERRAGELDEVQRRNIYLIRKAYDEATRIPEELVAQLAKQEAISVDAWKRAKAASEWKTFEPELVKLVELVRRKAEILQEVKETATSYDSLLDIFEPGMTEDTISRLFGNLRSRLVPLVQRYTQASSQIDTSFLRRPVPIPMQRRITQDLASFIQYDVTSKEAGGRIDETEHPFTTGCYDDVRITVHYYEDNVASAIFTTLHEGGHALYDQNLNREWRFQPVGDAASYGIHESQSRFIENMVGRSPQFWQYYLPRLNELTEGRFKDVPTETFVQAVNQVKPSKIRIEADEVTYSLHVVIRFEIERQLFGGKLQVPELPSIWNEKYDQYLGVRVERDSEGVLQDTHWASGYFGYFPSYALGNIYSGQFLEALERDIPGWRDEIAQGRFGPVKEWMVEHIHRQSRLYDPGELVQRVTGKELDAGPFLSYLESKYRGLFG